MAARKAPRAPKDPPRPKKGAVEVHGGEERAIRHYSLKPPAKHVGPRFAQIQETPTGFQGLDRGTRFSAGFANFLIHEAWLMGADFEDLADGFGPGAGTKEDWSAIRDSSPEAKRLMLEAALNFLFGGGRGKRVASMESVLASLVQLARMRAGHHAPLISSDLLPQGDLYAVQERLTEILAALAAEVPGGAERLRRELPWVFGSDAEGSRVG